MIRPFKYKFALKGLFGGLCLLVYSTLWGQPGFNKVVPLASHTQQVIQQDSFYYSMGQYYGGNGRFGLSFHKLDSMGRVIKEKILFDPDTEYFPSNHISLEYTKRYGFTSVITYDNPDRQVAIITFNRDLRANWKGVPNNDNRKVHYLQHKITPDSGIVIIGQYLSDTVKRIYSTTLIKLDDNLGLEWERFFQDTGEFSLYPYHIALAPDHGYLISGRREIVKNNSNLENDPFLLRVDSLGNILWKKAYGGNSVDDIATAVYRDDGNIMLYYTRGIRRIHNRTVLEPVFSIVDDHTGSILQEKSFYFAGYEEMYSHKLLKDGNKFIGVGKMDMSVADSNGGSTKGYTIAVDESLQGLWFKYYTALDTLTRPNQYSYLYDLRSATDGGYIGGGFAFILDTSIVPSNIGFNGWILKLDSNGCLANNCVNYVSEDEVVLKDEKALLEIYPNPSSGHFTINWPGAGSGKATLYDLQGRYIQSIKLVEGMGILNPQSNLPEGLYILRVQHQDGRSRSEKLMIK